MLYEDLLPITNLSVLTYALLQLLVRYKSFPLSVPEGASAVAS
jgi:hypothetical protein